MNRKTIFIISLIVLSLQCELLDHNKKCQCQVHYYLTIKNYTADTIKQNFDLSQSTYPANYFIDTALIYPNTDKNDSIKYSMMGIDKECCMTTDNLNMINSIIGLVLIRNQDTLKYKLRPFDTLGSGCFSNEGSNDYKDTIIIKNSVHKK